MFPNYKTIKKKFLFFKYNEKVEDGWEVLEQVCNIIEDRSGCRVTEEEKCKKCLGDIYIAKENNKIFKFCSRCYKKIENQNDCKIVQVKNYY